MELAIIDWVIILAFFLLSLLIGLYASKRAGKNIQEFFLSNRNLPWGLLGISMVATTFSCDTPNLVTDIVRQDGVYGNWAWWAFLLTGMVTVFIYARLWRRSGVLTDLEFYEIRYSGKLAAFLRGFRAVYLGLFFNVIVIALVSLAIIKIGAIMLNWSAARTLIVISVITLTYSTLGGLRGIVLTDFFQFILTMVGIVGAAIVVVNLPEVGGLDEMLSHPEVKGKLGFFPDYSMREAWITLIIVPLAVQWWSVWYPGSEPGGGGYIAQRMLSAKSESGATKATLLFNIGHYVLRPWPWIVVALASIIVFPDLESLKESFPHINEQYIKHDLAYPAMLTFLPKGLLGIVVASLVAAYMSTVSTQLNWGASYLINDFYKRFVRSKASDKELVLASRITTVILMICAGGLTLALSNALQAFHILLQIGAGTGLIYLLRWFWWRINGYSEISAMIISFLVALYFEFIHSHTGLPALEAEIRIITGVGITTITWLLVTMLTPAESKEILYYFYRLVQPGGPGWKKVREMAREDGVDLKEKKTAWAVPNGLLCTFIGTFAIFSALFAIGSWIYSNIMQATILTIATFVLTIILMKVWALRPD